MKLFNGEIRISGEEYGCIMTNPEFENYRIVVEFGWGEITFQSHALLRGQNREDHICISLPVIP